MHHHFCRVCIGAVLATAVAVAPRVHAAQHEHQPAHPAGGAHHHPEAAKLKNPVPATAASVASGQSIYAKQCAGCHGDTGKGDGAMGEELNPKPPNLTDADWKHGSTDGEIFVLIRDGSKGTGMKGYKSKLTEHQIWDVVNYVRSLGPVKSH
jgi:cbb3-type cytochrome c oxidase subunit III